MIQKAETMNYDLFAEQLQRASDAYLDYSLSFFWPSV